MAMKETKKSALGRAARRHLIDQSFGPAEIDIISATYRASQACPDDIYDAFAALWTAQRIAYGTAVVIPEQPPVDSEGLRMGDLVLISNCTG